MLCCVFGMEEQWALRVKSIGVTVELHFLLFLLIAAKAQLRHHRKWLLTSRFERSDDSDLLRDSKEDVVLYLRSVSPSC